MDAAATTAADGLTAVSVAAAAGERCGDRASIAAAAGRYPRGLRTGADAWTDGKQGRNKLQNTPHATDLHNAFLNDFTLSA